MKAKYQDNLEMMQWIKRYWDINNRGDVYDAVGRRKGVDLYLIGEPGGRAPPAKPSTALNTSSSNASQASAPKKTMQVSVSATAPFNNLTNKVANSIVFSANQQASQKGAGNSDFGMKRK